MEYVLIPEPGVFFEVDTFDPLQDRGPALAQWLEDARRVLVEPLVATVSRERSRVALEWTTRSGVHSVDQRYEPTRWQHLLEQVEAGAMAELSLGMDQLDDDGRVTRTLAPIRLRVELTGLEYDGAANRISFVAGRPLFGDVFAPEEQARLVGFAKRAACEFRACGGYITLDYAGEESPYEMSIGRTFLWALKECAEFLRGYYWGNFLTARHVQRLGGLAAISRNAPCALVEELAADPVLVYVQLTHDLDHFSDDELRELWAYLHPVLPQTERIPSQTGWPLRIVHGPAE